MRTCTEPPSKRLFDLLISSLLLLASAPVLLAVVLLIKVDSRGPILYRSRRRGLDGREFDMFKFRKMHRDAEGPALTSARDSRFTRVGRLLALARLDELPQLLNVVLGQMSLVGPRPEDPSFVALYPERFAIIQAVKPGLTGLSQLAFVHERRLFDVHDPVRTYTDVVLPGKLVIDELYVRQRTFGMDLRILGWTLAAVLGAEIAVDRRNGRLTLRRRTEAAPQAALGDG